MAIIDSVKLPDNSTYEVADNHSGYQTETLTTPLTINGTQETTVEGALGGLNDYGDALADNLAANENVYGAKNLLPYPYHDTTKTENAVTFTDNGDGTVTISGNASAHANFALHNYANRSFFLSNGTYKLGTTNYLAGMYVGVGIHNQDGTMSYYDTLSGEVQITINGSYDTPSGAYVELSINVFSGTSITTPITVKPMICDARIIDPTFVPFAETNLQLTRKTSGLSNRNFLDNPFFTINQRGATTVTSGYGADRWFLGGGDVGSNIVFAPGSATLTNVQMQQYFEKQIPNGTYTLSVKKSDGTIYKGTINKTDDVSLFEAVNNEDVYVGYNAHYKMFVISTYGKNTNTFVGTKLEPGSVSTLANDVAPDYAFELAKCQTSKADPLDTYANQGEIAVTSQLSNRNLLDNPWFTVNQRGFTSGDFTTSYTVDRWKKEVGVDTTGSVSVWVNGIVILDRSANASAGLFYQYKESLEINKHYTISVEFGNGAIEYASGFISSTSDRIIFSLSGGKGQVQIYYHPDLSRWVFEIMVNSGYGIAIRAAKLEVGSVSTLHLDTEPNYTTEYLKCRRYFKRFKGEFGIGCVREYATSPINFLFRIKIPNDVPMRSDSPSVVVNGNIRIPDYAGVYTGSDLINVSGAKDSSVINMDIYSNSTLPAQPMAKGMAANVDVYIFGPNDGALDLVDEL